MKKAEQALIVYNIADQQCSSSEYIPDYEDISELQRFRLERSYKGKLRQKQIDKEQIEWLPQVILNYPVNLNKKRHSKRQVKKVKKQHKEQNRITRQMHQQCLKYQEGKVESKGEKECLKNSVSDTISIPKKSTATKQVKIQNHQKPEKISNKRLIKQIEGKRHDDQTCENRNEITETVFGKDDSDSKQDNSNDVKQEQQSEPPSKLLQFLLRRSKPRNESTIKQRSTSKTSPQVTNPVEGKKLKKRNKIKTIIKLQQ